MGISTLAPVQLRDARVIRTRAVIESVEAAGVVLWHADAQLTKPYAERHRGLAVG